MKSATGYDLRRRIDPVEPALLRVLPSGAGRRAADLRRGGADRADPRRHRAAARRRPPAGADRARLAPRCFIRSRTASVGSRILPSAIPDQSKWWRNCGANCRSSIILLPWSPVPGFMQWLKDADDLPLTEEDRRLFETPRATGLGRRSAAGSAVTLGARAAGGLTISQGPHAERPIDRSRGAVPPSATARIGWSGSTGWAISRRRVCASPPASWSIIFIVSKTSRRTTKPTPIRVRSLPPAR